MEELLEIIAWLQLGIHDKPVSSRSYNIVSQKMVDFSFVVVVVVVRKGTNNLENTFILNYC